MATVSLIEAPALERGDAIGRYVIVETIGRGGMGVVYAAYDPQLERKVALKFITSASVDGAPPPHEQTQRLLREAQAMAKLSHPNVVTLHDVGSYREQLFLAMELVPGETFDKWQRARERRWPEILRVAVEAGRGLAAAHAVGLVHRDFKPSNILVGEDGRARVLDFGLARLAEIIEPNHRDHPSLALAEHDLSESMSSGMSSGTSSGTSSSSSALSQALTEAGALLGTPGFMSPEQLLQRPVDARSDQFSFAVTLYQALYGERPFPGKNVREHTREVLAGNIRPPPEGARVPARIRKVLLRGLSVDPEERYPSLAALLADLPEVTAARPYRLAALAALGLAAAAVVLPLQARQRRAEECNRGEEQLHGVWDRSRRDALGATFHASGLPYADDVLVTVQRRLDDYTGRWVAMHRSACQATRLQGEQSEEVLTLRNSCLDRRLQALDAQLTVLARGGEGAVQRSVAAVEALPPIADCGDIALLKTRLAPPKEADKRLRIAALWADVATATALSRIGQATTALERLEPVMAEARRVDYPLLDAEVQTALYRARSELGELPAMREAAREAARASVGARDDLGAARALERVASTALKAGQLVEARQWIDLARAHLEGIGVTSGEAHVRTLGTLARIETAEGHPAEALGHWQEVVRLLEQRRGGSIELARALGETATLLAGLGRAEESLALHRRALTLLEESVGPRHPDLAAEALAITALSTRQRRPPRTPPAPRRRGRRRRESRW